MRSQSFSLVSLCALLAACSQHSPSMSIVPEELQEPFVAPAIQTVPEVWETAGSELTPHFQLVNGPAAESMQFVFAYEGSGHVQVPKGASVAAGETEFQFDGTFSCDSTDVETTGTVEVLLVHDELGPVQVGEWSVLHRPSIVHKVKSLRVDPLRRGMLYACLVAVDYDPMVSGADAPSDRSDWIQIETSVERQGSFHPKTHVERDVQPNHFSSLPRDFKFADERLVFYVEVERPSHPQTRRAYLSVTVRIGGDEHRIHVALPNR